MTEQSIGDILNGEEPAAEAPPEEVVAETVEAEPVVDEQPEQVGQPRGPDGKFLPKGEPETAISAPPAPQEEPGHIPIAALKDERSKRQTLENELAQLREQMQRMQQPQPIVQPEGPPDQWDDPDGYRDWLIKTAEERATQAATQAFNIQRIRADAAQFSVDKPDYDQTIQAFRQLADVNPALYEQMQAAPSPAKFAYETARTHLEIQQYGSLDALIAARVEAAQKEALAALPSQLPSLPPSISSDRSVGSRSGPAWSGPASIDDLLR
jgi:hypothetical protein